MYGFLGTVVFQHSEAEKNSAGTRTLTIAFLFGDNKMCIQR